MISGDATVERAVPSGLTTITTAGPRELFTELDAAHSQPYGKLLVINRQQGQIVAPVVGPLLNWPCRKIDVRNVDSWLRFRSRADNVGGREHQAIA